MNRAVITTPVPEDCLPALLKAYACGVSGLTFDECKSIEVILEHLVDEGQNQQVLTGDCTLRESRQETQILPDRAKLAPIITGAAIKTPHDMPLRGLKRGEILTLRVINGAVTSGHHKWSLATLATEINQGAWWYCARYARSEA